MSNYSTKQRVVHFFQKKSVMIAVTCLIVAASFMVYEFTKKPVTLYANGETIQFTTHARTVKDALMHEELELSRFDSVQPSLNTAITPNIVIEWEQAKEVVISVDQKRTTIWTTKNVVGEILAQANIDVTEHDIISHDLHATLDEDNKIKIQKAFEVTLTDGDTSEKLWSTATTVDRFLQQQGVEVEGFDRIDDKLHSKITPGQEIEVVRVQKVTDVVEEPIDFTVEKKYDASLVKGSEKVTQQGSQGKVARTYEVTHENGQEVSRTLKEEEVIVEPVKQVITVGTKVDAVSTTSRTSARAVTAPATQNKVQTVVTQEVQTTTLPVVSYIEQISSEPEQGRELYVTATAYTATCKGCSGITKTGINLLVNPHLKVIAVDPKVIPLGSKVWVEGYGHAVAGDIGGAIKGNKIDLFMPRIEDAYAWGRRTVRMKVLN